jgi:hypothetical protein
MGYPTGVLIDASKGTPTDNNITANQLFVQNTIIAGCAKPTDYSASSTAATGWTADAVNNWFITPAYGNTIFATNDEVKLAAPFNYALPDFTPQAGSPLLTGASFTNSKLSGFTPVTYIGAVGPAGTADADWWKGWSKINLAL